MFRKNNLTVMHFKQVPIVILRLRKVSEKSIMTPPHDISIGMHLLVCSAALLENEFTLFPYRRFFRVKFFLTSHES